MRMEIWSNARRDILKVEIVNATGTKFLKFYGENTIKHDMAFTGMKKIVSLTDLKAVTIHSGCNQFTVIDEDDNIRVYNIKWNEDKQRYIINVSYSL